MTKTTITLIALVVLLINSQAQTSNKITLENGNMVSFNMKNGQFHGNYTSWYKNGKKKAEGKFYHNNRIGTWSVWDYNGNKKIEREYQNNMVYEKELPKISKKDANIFYNKYLSIPTRNDNQTLEYYHLEEDSILYAVRNTNIILPKNNPLLFENNNIIELLIENRKITEFATYDIFGKYDKSTFEIESSDNLKIIAYKIQREFVFDKNREIIETREVFISPVIQDIKTKEVLTDNWFYFPDIRPKLATIKVSAPDCTLDIENISDLFFWMYNSEIIIKENKDVFKNNKDIDNSIFTDINKLNEYLDSNNLKRINRIETEHALWLKFIDD